MRVHNIIDFNPIYYKYKFRYRSGNLRKLSYEGKDISLIYYVIKEIESFRDKLESLGNQVVTTVCFDSKNLRKDLIKTSSSDSYKEGRVNHLDENDYRNIEEIEELLRKANMNTLKCYGAEADDLVKYACDKTKEDFDHVIIYTNDKDLLTNVRDNVAVMRYKTKNGWTLIHNYDYERVVSEEFKAVIPYNSIALFLSLVGDSGDNIKGVKGLGAKSFNIAMIKLSINKKINWEELSDYDKVAETIIDLNKYDILNSEQLKQAIDTFNIVRPIEITQDIDDKDGRLIECDNGIYKIKLYYDGSIEYNESSREVREEAYSKYDMKSLYK